MNKNRVVITGMGVYAPNGVGLDAFRNAIKAGESGIRHYPELEELNFRCQLGGMPEVTEGLIETNFSLLERKRISARGVIYGMLAAQEAWSAAGLPFSDKKAEAPNWNWGAVFGAGIVGIDTLRTSIYKTDEGEVRKLGTSVVSETMPSGISALLGGKLGLGNWVTSNASACSTGTESILMAADHIRQGRAQIMLAGSCDAGGPYVWGGFDSMKILTPKHNHEPEQASRPMAADASGFVPGCGAGALVLESLESAEQRGAQIYGEILGGAINSGGQRGGGSMTAPNNEGIQRCIRGAIEDAGINAKEIDLISGHLTSTKGDVAEVLNWSEALERKGADFPKINSLKSLIGHCLSAAGSIETVAAILQLHENFIHPNLNCEEPHSEIADRIDAGKIPLQLDKAENNIVAKASFGFGDVNSCIIIKDWNP